MAEAKNSVTSIDTESSFCSKTNIYHSLRLPAPFPPLFAAISVTEYIFSLPNTSLETMGALIDSTTGDSISYSELRNQIKILASSLQSHFNFSIGDTAYILSPANPQVLVLYYSLLSIGVVISPSNPSASTSEISHQLDLCKPVIAFVTSSAAHKLPTNLRFPQILLDSYNFISMVKASPDNNFNITLVRQSDPAVILFSSGTTGRIKGVVLTHHNLTSYLAGICLNQPKGASPSPAVVLCTVPCFHVYGFMAAMKAITMGETLVMMQRFELGRMMRAVEEFSVTVVAVAPPVVVAMAKRDFLVASYNLSSLEVVHCGGAPLGVEVIARFKKRFPNVMISQGYGMTETCPIFRTIGPEECRRYGSTGKLASNCEAKIVDPDTGHAMPPLKRGELWIRGPTIMKGYIGDEEATMSSLDSDGWLRSGDLCYIDDEGFLYVVDRLKEMIKYKGFQVPPAELENLLQSHPDIVDAAVIPYPDEAAGQVPMAFVVKRPQSCVDGSQIMDFIAKQVAPYKKIRRVAFIDSIPKNAPGKILRKELIKLALPSSTITSRL